MRISATYIFQYNTRAGGGRGGGFKKEFLMNWGKKCKMGHQKASFFILFDTCDPKIIYFPKVSRKKPLKIINRP